MRLLVVCSLLLLGYTSFGQEFPYKVFEVDTAAEPRGGMAAFNSFILVNLRKPVAAQAEGITGIVVLSGTIETDGHISDLSVIRRLRPDCDREAIRVCSLFKGWKPAVKAGKPVRQQVNMSIAFKANERFVWKDGAKVTYFSADSTLMPVENEQTMYRQIMPLDTNGLPNGDLVVYKRNGEKWRVCFRDKLIRKKTGGPEKSDNQLYILAYESYFATWQNGDVYTITESGQLKSIRHFRAGQLAGTQSTFLTSGMLSGKIDYTDYGYTITTWYSNGLIKEVREKNTYGTTLMPDQIVSLWDTVGQQIVKNGNGWATYNQRVHSHEDPSRPTVLTIQGQVVDKYKQGTWTELYQDRSFYREELYSRGIFQKGKMVTFGEDTVHYDVLETVPRFSGGMSGLKVFLKENLHYPELARQANVQGMVVVSFVVCQDGTLCDHEVVKSVYPSLDAEAIRVVKQMNGLWKPGEQRGEKIRVKYNIPVNFSLY